MIDNILNEAKADTRTPWSAAEFETLLRGKSTSYHIHHPFHVMMAQGKLNAAQLRGWVANRWCELLPLPLELKQRLMELDNPLVRLELVSDILERTGIAL